MSLNLVASNLKCPIIGYREGAPMSISDLKRIAVISSLFLAFGAIGCARMSGFGGSGSAPQNNKLGEGIQAQALQILQNRCTSCHQTASGPKDVKNLLDVNYLLSANLITAGDPANSRIFGEISGNDMPPTGGIPESEKTIISDWILSLKPAGPPPQVPPSEPPPAEAPTFKEVSVQIFGQYCIGCHNVNTHKAGFAFDSYAGVLKAVVKGSPANSIIWNVTNQGAMPPKQTLSVDQVRMISDWIQAGALDN